MQAVANAVQDVCRRMLSKSLNNLIRDVQRMGEFPTDVKSGYKAREDGSKVSNLTFFNVEHSKVLEDMLV